MNMDQLKYFVDLSKTNSVSETAKRMFISHQAVSESIKRLGNELGCVLTRKTTKGIEFTDEGKIMLDYAIDILNKYEKMEQVFLKKEQSFLSYKLIRIGIGAVSSNTFLPNILLKLHRLYPNNVFQVYEYNRQDLLSLIANDELDFGLYTSLTKDLKNSNNFKRYRSVMHIEKLFTDKMVCVMSKNNALSVNKTLTFNQLKTQKHTNFGYYDAEEDEAFGANMGAPIHTSSQAEIHQLFMLEENCISIMPYQVYNKNFPSDKFSCRHINIVTEKICRAFLCNGFRIVRNRFNQSVCINT